MGCTVIQNAIVLTVNAEDQIYPNGCVVVRDDRIVAVGPQEDIPVPADVTQVLDGRGRMALIPGLIDTHSHSSLLRGVSENRQLLDWLPHYQLEHRVLTEADAYYTALLCYLEALKAGTTCVMDMYRLMHRCAEAAGVLGMRAHLVPYVADMPGKTFFESLESNRRLIETHHQSQSGRIQVWLGLEHLFYCTETAYRTAREYADYYNVGIHTHTSEQREEVEAVVQHFGKRPIELFYERGILGPRTAIAHCVWLDPTEIRLMVDTGTAIAHCPTSNAKLAGGIAPLPELQQAGIRIGLGTDGNISNNSLDMFELMKFASLLQKVQRYDATALSAPQALRLATIEGAKVLGQEQDLGSLEVGKKADLVLVNLWQPNLMPIVWDDNEPNVLWNLVYAARGANVDTVMVDGAIVVQGGRSTRIDEAAALEAIQAQTLDLMQRRAMVKQSLTTVVG